MTRPPGFEMLVKQKSGVLHEWWRVVATGAVLAGLLFLVFFRRGVEPTPPADGPPVVRVIVPTPELDLVLVGQARDETREERLVIETKPLAHLLQQSIDIVPSIARELGMPDEAVPIDELRANPNRYRGQYLWYRGTLRYLSRGKSGHPVDGFKIYEGWLTTATGDDVVFRVSLEPRDVKVGDHVRIEGFLMKLHDSHSLPETDRAPLLVGPQLFRDFPPWQPVTELDPTILASVDDTIDPSHPEFQVQPVWDTLAESQHLPLWHLTSYARSETETVDVADWSGVPAFVSKEQLDSLFAGTTPRGTPFRILGAFVQARTWEATPNPLGEKAWSEVLVQIHDLGGKLVPVWVPGRVDLERRAPLEIRGFYFRNLAYETLRREMVKTPVFVAAAVERFELPKSHALEIWLKIGFAILVLGVIGMFVWIARRDRQRQALHRVEMDERRRRRELHTRMANDS